MYDVGSHLTFTFIDCVPRLILIRMCIIQVQRMGTLTRTMGVVTEIVTIK